MPVYQYKCSICGSEEELFQSIKYRKAPVCCGKEMDRKISNSRAILKGDCWAKDGYSHLNKEACERTIGPSPLIYKNKYFKGGLS